MTEIDYYSQVESAVMTKLRSLEIFPESWQVSDSVANIKRGASYFAIFIPSTFQTSRVDGREKAVIWNSIFDFYSRYTTYKESLDRFKAGRKELFILNKDPLLNRTPGVYNVALSATSEVLQDIPGENPNFVIQTFNVAVSQRIRFVP